NTNGVTLDTDFQAEHALLHDYRLRTNYFASTHGAGACNIEPAPDHHVEGVVLTITPAVQDVLRFKEGFPLRYGEIDVIVHTTSTQASVRALTYVVTPTHRLDVDLPVTARYRALILAGAKHFDFSKAYQQELRRKLRTAPSLLTLRRSDASL
ncbi:MAG: gamma-glutamylcyclotransferase, partial [Planctomycetes bacterium]|nr:gamma-glutamylcyclotransferase [Planctomycetota bacterium]